MPPKFKITREMIVEAGFCLVRESGLESVNARNIAARLGCSTQPVLYSFKTVDEIKRAIYEKADRFHTEYLMNVQDENVLLRMGLNYIRFAIEEPNLFCFLFQSGYAREQSLSELTDSVELTPVLEMMSSAMGRSIEQTREIFVTLSLFAHGCASIIANNALEYDETFVAKYLDRTYRGAVLAIEEETK